MANEKPLDLSTLQAGLKRYDDSLAKVAKSGDYNDLLNLPSSSSGNVIYGSSSVNANTARKLITIYSGPTTLEQYDVLIVKLERGNNVDTPTIGIGQSTYNIKVGSDAPSSMNPLICTSNSILRFMYVGGYLHYIDSPGCYSAICQTSASTQEKSIDLSDNCIIRSGTKISVQFTQGNSFANTVKLVINGSRANVWASNSETSDTNQLTFDANTTVDFVNWRGHWEVVSDPTLPDIAKTGEYSDLKNAPFISEQVPKAIAEAVLRSTDVISGNEYSAQIPEADAFAIGQMLYSAYSQSTGSWVEEDMVIGNITIDPKVDGVSVQSPSMSIYHTVNYEGLRTDTFYITINSGNDTVCRVDITYVNGPEPSSGLIRYGYDEYTTFVTFTDRIEVFFNDVGYKFTMDPNSEFASVDYSDLTGIPFEKTVVSNDTTHFYTLSSNDHIERKEGDVWRTEIDDDFKTGLLLVIENSPEFENMPTDYMEAIEVPSSILSVDVFLNVQQSIGSDITTRIFKNTLNEHVIMFKYQDAYIIGDMNLDTGYITYREEYITSSSPIGINVWQVKYTFEGTHIVWAPTNEDEKFEMFRIRDISTGLLEIAANDYVNGTETCPTINGYIPIGIVGYERMDVLVDARLYNDNTAYVRYGLHNATSSAIQANVHFIILYTRSSFFREAY